MTRPSSTTGTPSAVQAAALTDQGRVRDRNEDAFLIDRDAGLFVVADGMGGHRCGDLASSMAVRLLPEIHRERASVAPPATESAVAVAFARSVTEVSRRIHTVGRERPDCHGMGTTLVAVLVADGNAHVAHLGDSRAYLLRDHVLHQLTHDHSVVGDLVRLGEVSAEDAAYHPAQNQLTNFAGISSPVHPDVVTLGLRLGDRLLLCTDGVWSTVTSDELRTVLAGCAAPRTACRRLVAKGNAAGGHDNLTALVIDYRPRPVRS